MQWSQFLLLLLIIGVQNPLHYVWYLWWGKWLWRSVLSLTFFKGYANRWLCVTDPAANDGDMRWRSGLTVIKLPDQCGTSHLSLSLTFSFPPFLPLSYLTTNFSLVCFWITHPTSDTIHVAQLLLCLPSMDTVMTFWLSVGKWAMKWAREKWGHAKSHLVQIRGRLNATLWQELKVRNIRVLWMHEITLWDLIDPFESTN